MSDNVGAESTPPKFEAALDELEQIVQTMESGQVTLEESLAAYQRGSLLLKHCQQQLIDAEQRLLALEGETLQPVKLTPNAK